MTAEDQSKPQVLNQIRKYILQLQDCGHDHGIKVSALAKALAKCRKRLTNDPALVDSVRSEGRDLLVKIRSDITAAIAVVRHRQREIESQLGELGSSRKRARAYGAASGIRKPRHRLNRIS